MFEKSRFTPHSILAKALEEAEIWTQAQQPDQATHMALESTNSSVDAWEKPPSEMVKCNVGMAWVDAGPVNGSSWILRDDHGQPLQHSREALTGSSSKMESDLKSLLWAVQAMALQENTV